MPGPITPQPTSPQAKLPEIHVMPEQFYGAALAYREPKKAPPPPRGGAAGVAKIKKPPIGLMLGVGVVILAALGVGAFFLLRSEPQPASRPGGVNANTNRPVNANAPANINANVNTNINVNAPVNVNANVPVPSPAATPLRSSIDSDVDGLTDVEEALYGTGVTRPDSDGDGFLDGNEVFHLYNPAALAPTTLRDSGLVRIHEDSSFGFEILYPAAWTRRTLEAAAPLSGVIFTSASGESVQVSVEANPLEQNAADWYLARSPGVARTELESIVTKGGYSAIHSQNRLTTYIASGARLYIISYGIGNSTELNYRQTYEMMVNSFGLVEITPAPPSTTATSTP